jgi:hypothetical protein
MAKNWWEYKGIQTVAVVVETEDRFGRDWRPRPGSAYPLHRSAYHVGQIGVVPNFPGRQCVPTSREESPSDCFCVDERPPQAQSSTPTPFIRHELQRIKPRRAPRRNALSFFAKSHKTIGMAPNTIQYLISIANMGKLYCRTKSCRNPKPVLPPPRGCPIKAPMAGFGQSAFAQNVLPLPNSRALPTGACNHRDIVGTCGCRHFWDKCSADIHESSRERKSNSERSTYCVCGHHACFHEASVAPATSYSKPDELLPAWTPANHNAHNTTLNGSSDQYFLHNRASQANGSRVDEQGHEGSLMSSTTGLPRIPSVCLLSDDRYPKANALARNDANQSCQSIAGLGLSTLNVGAKPNFNDGQHSVTSTVPDEFDFHAHLQAPHGELYVPTARDNSVAGVQQSLTCSAPGPLDAIREYNQMLHLDVSGDTIPNTYNPQDIIQSATEVATPSNANTPDLGVTDQAVGQGKRFIEGLMRLTSNMEQGASHDARPATATSAPAMLPPSSPHPSQEQLHSVLRTASPQALQKLVSYLTPLHNLLSSIPNVANTMREHNDRLSMLENTNSFNYVHPEEMQQTFDTFDGRILHLENRMDDHDTLHQMIDADQSNQPYGRRHIAVTESFGSNHSCQSTTSSALILAAMDRKDVATEIGTIKDRLEVLEAAALPTTLNPWEVEIVVLPWGRDLRGIWFSPDEPMHEPLKSVTQDSEEWTQARSSTLGQSRASLGPFRDTDSSPHPSARSRSSHPFSDSESGWSSQEISEWASGSSDDLLSPKACGSNNLVYKRLKSRGFVLDVKLTSASANDIQATISHAYKDLLGRFNLADENESAMINSYPGLRASFIPLRKVAKDSRLRFLTPSEMASSALWSAQFLAAGVMMRVSGGKKRLYVTERESYIQSDDIGGSWTWQQMRILPRHQPDADLQMDGNDEQCQPQVPEADAREACWAFFEAYDAPPASINSSFASRQSVELSMRPADRDWRRSMTPSSILRNRQPPQPISPLSEFHQLRPSRQRTASASMIEPMISTASKRRLNSSPVKQSSAPQQPGITMARLKRRRVTDSSSSQPEARFEDAHATSWANTPRRSREPQSPFFSSEPQLLPLPRTSSDLTSRPSEKSLAALGRSTPSAYATPYSGAFLADCHIGGGGDTEPDDDNMYQDDDGEQSWRGLTNGEDESGSDNDAEAGAEIDPASFSSAGSPFNSDDDDSDSGIEDVFAARHKLKEDDGDDSDSESDSDEDEDADDIYDTLLGVLQR